MKPSTRSERAGIAAGFYFLQLLHVGLFAIVLRCAQHAREAGDWMATAFFVGILIHIAATIVKNVWTR